MLSIQPELLYECDERGRTPLLICTQMKPKMDMLTFLHRFYPALFVSSSHSSIDAPKYPENLLNVMSSPVKISPSSMKFDEKYLNRRKRSSLRALWASIKTFAIGVWGDCLALLLSPFHKAHRKSCRSWQSIRRALSAAVTSLLSVCSRVFGKKNEELSKSLFRSNILSSAVILFYICIFIRDYVVSIRPYASGSDAVSVSYSTPGLILVNMLGWGGMCGSFFMIYFTPPQSLPARCRDDYVASLDDIVKYISETSEILFHDDICSNVKHQDKITPHAHSDEGSVPCTGGLFLRSVERSSPAPPGRERPYVCHRCRYRLPLRSGHCKELDQCVLLYDHYCYFVWSVIHRDNYLYFFWYILSVTIYLPVYLLSTKRYAKAVRPTSHFLLYFNIWVCLVWLWVICLTCYQVHSIYLGVTTRERMKRPEYTNPESPFNTGSFWGNVYQLVKNTNFGMTCAGVWFAGALYEYNSYQKRPDELFFSRGEALKYRKQKKRSI